MTRVSFILIALTLAWQAITPVIIIVFFEIFKIRIDWIMPVIIGIMGIVFPFSGYYLALSHVPAFKKTTDIYRGIVISTISIIITGIIAICTWVIWAYPIIMYIINQSRSRCGYA